MAATATDTEETLFADQNINADAIAWSGEIDRGADTLADLGTVLLEIDASPSDSWAAITASDGYLRVLVAPLDGTAGTRYDDITGAPIAPVSEFAVDAALNEPVAVMLPQGCRYFQIGVQNKSGQNIINNAASAKLLYQAVTL